MAVMRGASGLRQIKPFKGVVRMAGWQRQYFKLPGTSTVCMQATGRRTRKSLFVDLCIKKGTGHAAQIEAATLKANLPKDFWQRSLAFGGEPKTAKMPAGFVFVSSERGRRYFVDSSGTGEAEVFIEQSNKLKTSALADKLYASSVKKVLSARGWKFRTASRKSAVRCLLFLNQEQASNFCFVSSRSRKEYKRLVFIMKFRPAFIKTRGITKLQLATLAQWQKL